MSLDIFGPFFRVLESLHYEGLKKKERLRQRDLPPWRVLRRVMPGASTQTVSYHDGYKKVQAKYALNQC